MYWGCIFFLVLHLNFPTLFYLLNDCVSDGEGEALLDSLFGPNVWVGQVLLVRFPCTFLEYRHRKVLLGIIWFWSMGSGS